jgi:hypothetical protein
MPLPPEILTARVRNELAMCSRYLDHSILVSGEDIGRYPLRVEVALVDIPGPVIEDGRVSKRDAHRFVMWITRDYPFEKPRVEWLTPIFHPNIMLPEDGGHVCIKLLDEWNFNSTLLSFLKGMEYLLLNPNPQSPFGSNSCTLAAEYFNKGGIRALPRVRKPMPKVVGRN